MVPPQHSLGTPGPTVERRLYPSLRHEIFHEPEGAGVLADVVDWLRRSLPSSPVRKRVVRLRSLAAGAWNRVRSGPADHRGEPILAAMCGDPLAPRSGRRRRRLRWPDRHRAGPSRIWSIEASECSVPVGEGPRAFLVSVLPDVAAADVLQAGDVPWSSPAARW